MYGVNSGVNFPNNYSYGKNAKAQSPYEQRSTPETKTSGRTDEILFSAAYGKRNNAVSSLSDEAKNLLAELREKYKGYDFMVADYETDEEAGQLLSQGKGEYNVLITPDLLEKMASDKSERAKYEDIIAGASDTIGEIEKNLTDNGKSIVDKLGFTVNADGKVNYYAGINSVNGATSGSSKFLKSSLVNELTDMVNKLADSRAEAIEAAKNKDKVEDSEETLSDKAKALLSELREKYKGYDFMIGKYATDEEAGRMLSGGKGTLMNVLITPSLLEEMASDESVRTKYENIIAGAADQFASVRANLTQDGKSVVDKLGATVNADGTMSYFANLVRGLTDKSGNSFLRASTSSALTEMINAFAQDKKDVSETENDDEAIWAIDTLSVGAKKVLNELSDKYRGYEFIVGNWKTDEEASRVLSSGRGRDGNVLISPELLEQMASDESVKEKYFGIIDEAAGNLDKVQDDLSEDGKSIVEKLGLTVGADGTVSYFAKLVDGVTADDGGDYIKCSIIEDFTKSLEALARTRQKVLDNRQDDDQIRLDTPEEKEEKVEKSVMPPKSFEKYQKEQEPYSTEEDYGNLPPESFKKYQTDADIETVGEVMNYSV